MQTNLRFRKRFIASILGCLFMALSVEAATLEFSQFDSYGRKVTSQDYKGVPIFLEFGACW